MSSVDHGLFFAGPCGRGGFDEGRPILETLKAWRRFLHSRCGA
jgi:hypothetical protein